MIVRGETVVAAAPEEVWSVVSDPEQLPRWWPGVTRVEEASPEAWTKVLSSPRGKAVRADYSRVEAVPGERLVWRQEVDQSPFERILASAITAVSLAQAGDRATRVTIALDQKPRGWARFGVLMLRKAARRNCDEALAGLAGLVER